MKREQKIYGSNAMAIMIASLKNVLYELEDHFSTSISIQCYQFENGVAYAGGIDEPKFNVFLQRSRDLHPESSIEHIKEFFKKHHIPAWVYVVPDDLDRLPLKSAFTKHKLAFDETSTAMYCALDTLAQSNIELKIPLIIQYADVNRNGWLQVMRNAFGGTNETIQQYDQALNRAKAKNVDMLHFLGTVEGQPVTTLTLTFLNDSVRIDNVSTAPTHQRLGYGTQMIQFGLNLSRAKEAKHCFLDASSKGLNVYKRLGFQELFNYHIYKYEA